MIYTRTSVSSIRLKIGKLFDRVSESLLWRGGYREEKLTPYAASPLEGENFLMTNATPMKNTLIQYLSINVIFISFSPSVKPSYFALNICFQGCIARNKQQVCNRQANTLAPHLLSKIQCEHKTDVIPTKRHLLLYQMGLLHPFPID